MICPNWDFGAPHYSGPNLTWFETILTVQLAFQVRVGHIGVILGISHACFQVRLRLQRLTRSHITFEAGESVGMFVYQSPHLFLGPVDRQLLSRETFALLPTFPPMKTTVATFLLS